MAGRGARGLQELEVPAGATVKNLVKAQGLEEVLLRVNGKTVRLPTKLRDGDLVIVTPSFIVGASAGRYDHLDLDKYRRMMSPRDFAFFVNFVGADVLGFRDEDLEAC